MHLKEKIKFVYWITTHGRANLKDQLLVTSHSVKVHE
jgi:hypothetical protein